MALSRGMSKATETVGEAISKALQAAGITEETAADEPEPGVRLGRA